MGWTWPDAESKTEAREHEAIARKMDAFWRAFVDKRGDLSALFARKQSWDLPAWMDRHLGAVSKEIMWEFGRAVAADGHRLVLTPEGARHLRPLVGALLARAPRIEGWEFYDARLPETGEALLATVEGRTGVALPTTRVRVERGEHHTLALTFELGLAREDAENVVGVLAETLLGEPTMDRWVGSLDVVRRSKKEMVPLADAPAAVAAEIEAIRRTLPETPYLDQSDDVEWSLFKADPPEQKDYPGQADLFVAPTMVPAVFLASRTEGFVDERFSRHGEIFAYVKIDGRKGSGFEDREAIENAIGAALASDRLGAVVGGGTGRFYSYVELALLDVPRALTAIREVLRAGGVSKRSWILFHDLALTEEGRGIFPDSPGPP